MRPRTILLGCAGALAASLLLARVHPFGDAGLYGQPAQAAVMQPSPIMEHAAVPPAVRDTLAAKCADCHSLATRPPLYARFAPVSWLLERDILEGRAKMNLSLWDTYSPDRQQTLKSKIVEKTRSRAMPLPQYRLLHPDSIISSAELARFIAWSHDAPPSSSADLTTPVTAGDPDRGRGVFEKRCTGCHSLDQSHEGPALRGVFGRRSATLHGFTYSDALKNAGFVWNDALLEQWLTDTDTLVPGNNMDFRVTKPQERKDLVSFLKTLSAQ